MNILDNELAGTSSPTTGLDVLEQLAQRDVTKTVTLSHPDLRGIRFVANVPRDADDMARLGEIAAKKAKTSLAKMSSAMFQRWQLAAVVQRIEVATGDGEYESVTVDGDTVNFASPELRARLGAENSADTVWRVIKDDGIIQALVARLGMESNFNTDADTAEDPTTGL